MTKAHASTVIHKPIQGVFDYTASPANGPAFIPNLNENSNIQPEQPGVGQKFDWRFNMAGVDLRGQAEVTEYNRPHNAKIVSTGDSNSTWVYSFEETDGGTKVTLDVDYEVAEGIMQKMANKMVLDQLNQRTAEQSLENLRTILEG